MQEIYIMTSLLLDATEISDKVDKDDLDDDIDSTEKYLLLLTIGIFCLIVT